MTAMLESERKQVRKTSENATRWVSLNRDLMLQLARHQFGQYRCTRLTMGDILRKDMRYSQALDTYLEVSYLDANGPMDFDPAADTRIFGAFRPFTPDDLMTGISDIVADYVNQMARSLGLTESDLRHRFLQAASPIQQQLQCPVAPEIAWRRLLEKLQ